MKTTLLLGILIFLASCSPNLHYFTQDLYNQNQWSESELSRIQFYLSQDLALRRQISEGESTIREGSIRIIDGQKVEEIVIPAGTPGVFQFSPKENRLAVSFEGGSDKRYLMFGPNPKLDNRYVLLASEWEDRQGKVTYDGGNYWVPAGNAMASLMVDLKRIRNVEVQSRVAGGRKVD